MRNSNTLRYFALTIGLILAVLMYSAQAQTNMILNGDFSLDTDLDGLGDYWQVGQHVNKTDILDGVQYIASSQQGCSQALIEQIIHTPSNGKMWQLDFDLNSDTAVYVIVWTLPHSGHCLAILPSGEFQHYSFTFVEDFPEIWGICFYTAGLLPAWINLDNVELVDLTTVGLGVTQDERSVKSGGIYDLLGRRLNKEPENTVFIRNHKLYVKIKN